MPRLAVVLAAVAATQASPAAAEEGQWMPKQIAELDQAQLRGLGLQLSAQELWNPKDQGLMKAITNFSGCSSGFISKDGLLATNHHCAYGAVQAASSVEHDYLADGFLASTRGDEIEAKGRTVKVLEKITDVTETIHQASRDLDDPLTRKRAARLAERMLLDECEKQEHRRCRVASFYSGKEYQLHQYLEIPDVRLVYVPPSSVGNYGGEVDNWMWPRHTGDFTLLRAYVGPDGEPAAYSEDNVPYHPERWLEVGAEGPTAGGFVAVLGYPGSTQRYLPASEMRRQLEQFLPSRVDMYGEWIDILEAAGAEDPAVKIKVAAKLRSLANRHKNSRGMIAGVKRNGLLVRREEEEARMRELAEKKPDAYAGVLDGLAKLAQRRRASFERDFLVDNLRRGPNALATAIDLVRVARETTKPDLERSDTYRDRGRKRLRGTLERRLKDYDADVDLALMKVLFDRIGALPPELAITGVRTADLGPIMGRTEVNDMTFVLETFEAADTDAIAKSNDPLIALARELATAIEKREAMKDRIGGEMLALGPKHFELLDAVREGPVYPDANGTLRFSYATIKGYAPRDGLVATAQTTLAGQVAKATAQAPFDLPQAVIDAAPDAAKTYWADPGLGDVPVCYLSTGDTTGGNSGSPMIDGQGRWIGLNFDRVWENIAGDFGYHPARSRNVGVDVRYLFWSLDVIANAGPLLEELGLADKRGAAARSVASGAVVAATDAAPAETGVPLAKTKPAEEAAPAVRTGGCGCVTTRRGDGSGLAGLCLGLVFFLRRRR